MFGFLRPPKHDRTYRQIYARCCSAQHTAYGLTALPFLSYEAVFLYLWAVEAGAADAPPAEAPSCCRLRTKRRLISASGTSVEMFIASLGLLLARIKLDDDVRDENSLLARLARWELRPACRAADGFFTALEPAWHGVVDAAIDEHLRLEWTPGPHAIDDYTRPTASAFGYMFGLLAELLPQHLRHERQTLVELGGHVGAAIVAWDCAVDWPLDSKRGRYNPLPDRRAVGDAFLYSGYRLSRAGWLCVDRLGRQSHSAAVLRAAFARACEPAASLVADQRAGSRALGVARRLAAARRGDCDCSCDAGDQPCCCDCCYPDDLCCNSGKKQSRKERKRRKPRWPRSKAPDASQPSVSNLALSPLDPCGIVSIAGERLPARAQGDWIPADRPVVVIEANPFGVIVRPAAGP